MRNPILVTFIPMVDYPINEFITWWIILNFILIAQIKTIKSFYAYFMYNFYEIFILNVNHHLMLTFGLQPPGGGQVGHFRFSRVKDKNGALGLTT